ncbi:MAG TPA: DUF1697 domain-containing protein [Vicinamibacterales bacterium]
MTNIALLRGINVGGNQMVAMSELRALAAKLGMSKVRTLLQSGNLVFDSSRRNAAQLEQLLEAEVARRFESAIGVFVRTAEEWKTVVARNPFVAEAASDPARLVAMFFKEVCAVKQVSALEAAIVGPERVRAVGRHLYLVYPDGMGRSKLTNVVIEKTLGMRGTARNWNTVLKLATAANSELRTENSELRTEN